jgi:glutamate transport system substrate-binding protein
VVGQPFSEERYGIGLPPDSKLMCERINVALNEMTKDGSWRKFIDRHTDGTGYSPESYDNPPQTAPCA